MLANAAICPLMPETIVENCPQQISKVKGGFIMQISKEMLIGELLQVDEEYGSDFNGRWNALHRMPVFSDGVSGRGCYGSWN